ncbi:MAG TPA: GntR family transcriptional regulator [Fimbriimonas sp.]|nr:GntR family transcriptional regulator [Fimbriimonas sp.]
MRKHAAKQPEPPSDKERATKHRAVADALREEILNGIWSAGDRIHSEQVIAKRFGVAYMTARQAVSSLVAEGVLERIARKGTFVRQEKTVQIKPSQRFRFLLLVEGGKTSLDPYYLPPIVEAFEHVIKAHGHQLAIYDYSRAILEGLIARDAPVCCVLLSEPEILYANLLRERGNRVYAINRCIPGGQVPFVAADNAGGAQAAVEHLISLGHERIGFVRGLPNNIDGADRRHGYHQAMWNHELPSGPEEGDHFIEACGYEAAKRMIASSDSPTAIFCASDLSAIGAMKAIAEAGLSVPRDISIVGFGDFPVAGFLHPGLTTVRLPMAELGRIAAREMLKLVRGETLQEKSIPCELVLRDTTAAPSLATHVG